MSLALRLITCLTEAHTSVVLPPPKSPNRRSKPVQLPFNCELVKKSQNLDANMITPRGKKNRHPKGCYEGEEDTVEFDTNRRDCAHDTTAVFWN